MIARRVERTILSFFLLFHLFALILGPSETRTGPIRGSFSSFFDPSLHFFEMTTRWSFFAPEPGLSVSSLEWEWLDKNGQSLGFGEFPNLHEISFFRESMNRRIVTTRFLLAFDSRVEKIVSRFLCQGRNDVSSVRLWRKEYQTPLWNEVASGKRQLMDQNSMHHYGIGHAFCHEATQ